METSLKTATGIVWVKNSSYIIAMIATIEWLGMRPEATLIFATLMLIDVVFGTIRAGIVEGGSHITSAIFTKGILAKILLLGVPVTCALGLKGIGFETGAFITGIVNILILSEVYSIIGNIHSTRTKKPKKEFDAVVAILGLIKGLLDRFLRDNKIT